MARRRKHLPRYQSALAGLALLAAERRLRKKTGGKVSWPLRRMGRGLLKRRVRSSSLTGLAIRLGSHLARQQARKRVSAIPLISGARTDKKQSRGPTPQEQHEKEQ